MEEQAQSGIFYLGQDRQTPFHESVNVSFISNIKHRIYQILMHTLEEDALSEKINIFLLGLIVLNAIAVVLETVKSFSANYLLFFRLFDVISVSIYTIEYLLRLWVCTEQPKYRHPVTGRLKFAITPFAFMDLLVLCPYFLPMILPFDLRFLRVVRLLRIFVLLKMEHYSNSLKMLFSVFYEKKEELATTFFVVFLMVIVASSLLYYAENEVQPQAFSSIPAAMWCTITTLTTIGYGDVHPITPIGKMIGVIMSLVGIGLYGLPTAIISTGFMEKLNKRIIEAQCPHCGETFEYRPKQNYIKE